MEERETKAAKSRILALHPALARERSARGWDLVPSDPIAPDESLAN